MRARGPGATEQMQRYQKNWELFALYFREEKKPREGKFPPHHNNLHALSLYTYRRLAKIVIYDSKKIHKIIIYDRKKIHKIIIDRKKSTKLTFKQEINPQNYHLQEKNP